MPTPHRFPATFSAFPALRKLDHRCRSLQKGEIIIFEKRIRYAYKEVGHDRPNSEHAWRSRHLCYGAEDVDDSRLQHFSGSAQAFHFAAKNARNKAERDGGDYQRISDSRKHQTCGRGRGAHHDSGQLAKARASSADAGGADSEEEGVGPVRAPYFHGFSGASEAGCAGEKTDIDPADEHRAVLQPGVQSLSCRELAEADGDDVARGCRALHGELMVKNIDDSDGDGNSGH
jgi:hypothetical protein